MLLNLKALVIVLALASTVFWLAKPIMLQFTSVGDFKRRRNLWVALTVAGFVAPNFWLFALVAVPLLFWGARRDPNPVALYAALLFVIPDIPVDIPAIGINHLFQVDIFRLLSLCILVPAAWRIARSKQPAASRGFEVTDLLLLSYGALRIILYVPPDPAIVHVVYQNSVTNALRSAFLFLIDIYVLYFVVSRSCTNRRTLMEIMATLCLAGVVLAPIAIFESARHWLLYAGISPLWGVPLPVDTYFFRSGSLRAQASAGHAITLGYLFDVALGFWLYIQSRVHSVRIRVAVPVLLGLGLLVTYSRAPWLTALLIFITFIGLGARSFPGLFKTACAAVVVGVAVVVSPIGYRIIKLLPFVGESAVSDSSLQYREALAERSWELIQQHPLFGQQFVYPQMEDLRQGQGIIDFVNTYAQIALFYGGVGLFLFLAFTFIAIARAHRIVSGAGRNDAELGSIGRSLLASMFGTLLLIATGSLMGSTEKVFYLLAGLLFAYVHLPRTAKASAPSGAVRAGHPQQVGRRHPVASKT